MRSSVFERGAGGDGVVELAGSGRRCSEVTGGRPGREAGPGVKYVTDTHPRTSHLRQVRCH